MIYTDLFKVQERHLESKLELISQEFIEFNYDKKLSLLTLEEVKELDEFAFRNVRSVMCFGIRKCIKRWERAHETTVEGGEYLRELNLREGED